MFNEKTSGLTKSACRLMHVLIVIILFCFVVLGISYESSVNRTRKSQHDDFHLLLWSLRLILVDTRGVAQTQMVAIASAVARLAPAESSCIAPAAVGVQVLKAGFSF